MLNIDLTKRIAVVTGASGELGREISRTLADCGADVVVCYHSAKERGEALASELRGRGVRSIAVQTDVTDEKSINSLRDRVQRELGDADIIVNDAVIQIHPWKSVMEQALSDYESQFRSCVMHNVLMARAFVPGMIRKKKGRVIGINTECAMRAFVTESAYVSGKRGMDGVLRVLAREVGEHQITVNQVAPGWTISERDRKAGTERNEGYDKTVALRRRGEDRDIANMVAFLASDLAGFVTGQYIAVSGGTVMPCI